MNTPATTREDAMITRGDAEAVIWRVATAAFTWYPSKHLEGTGYRIQEDIDWCLEPFGTLLLPQRVTLGERIRELITDPTADRQRFIRDTYALADDEPPTGMVPSGTR